MKTVCVLTAGAGTRMGRLAKNLNKALLPLGGKAILSQIINRFDPSTEFVIAVGHLGHQVKDYMRMAHPNSKVAFVEVDNYQGPGSGPGYSLLCCASKLQKPFYFLSCDTLWEGELENSSENWVGVAPVPEDESASYCNVEIEQGRAVRLIDKEKTKGDKYQAFVGLAYFQDYETFWKGLREPALIGGEHQVSNGIRALIEKGKVRTESIQWFDVGNEGSYRKAVQKDHDFDFSKTDECLYFVDGKVIKYFADEKIIQGRVSRAGMNPKVFPKIEGEGKNFYAYPMAPGKTFYEVGTPRLFSKFLDWLSQNLWVEKAFEKNKFEALCKDFYYEKTQKRLALYYEKYRLKDGPSKVNGVALPSTEELLKNLPWDKLFSGKPVFFHGDLQFDNVLVDPKTENFLLLDWRQDFAGETSVGDLYYDLAKLYGGILLNYDYIKKNLMFYHEGPQGISFDFAQRFQSHAYLEILENFIQAKNWDVSKVRTLVGLIYLNMSPLHEPPFDQLLYSLGRSVLAKEARK